MAPLIRHRRLRGSSNPPASDLSDKRIKVLPRREIRLSLTAKAITSSGWMLMICWLLTRLPGRWRHYTSVEAYELFSPRPGHDLSTATIVQTSLLLRFGAI